MRTLKLGSIALLLFSAFSCTKSSNTLEQQQSPLTAKSTTSSASVGNLDVDPGLVVNFNPTPGVVGQPVVVTGTFDGSTAIPDCGMLQLFEMVNGTWTNVAHTEVSSSVHQVSFEFTPAVVGTQAYQFYVHYVASTNCKGFSQTKSATYSLDVTDACHGLTITGKASATAVPAEPGMYYFTVNYTVNTCGVQYNHLKTQGGLTAWTTDVTDTTKGAQAWQVGNSTHPNTIVKWEENSPLPGNTKTYSVTFKKAWSGSGPIELTGAWSVTADLNEQEQATASFDPISFQ